MHGYIPRSLEKRILDDLSFFPIVAILGPRQCGKSTLAKNLSSKFKNFVYLDLESLGDLNRIDDPELFFRVNQDSLVCLDEIQRKPEIFSFLRSIVDRDGKAGRILILGSASGDLLRQSSESLAGRISYVELTPFTVSELSSFDGYSLYDHWFRGGYPRSCLAPNTDLSVRWIENFIKTYIDRDIPGFGIELHSQNLHRLFMMCAHQTGQILNRSKLGESLGVSYNTIKRYIDILEKTFVVRTVNPYYRNVKKRIVKSPKLYIRDTGLLHSLLGIHDFNDLLGNPLYGSSWETFVVENIISEMNGWQYFFYRTSNGGELDLVLERGDNRIGIEAKASTAPRPSKGFWNSLEDLGIRDSWIISPVERAYEIRKNVMVGNIKDFLSFYK